MLPLATSYQNATEGVRPLLNPDVANRLKPIWSLNKEGELNSVFRYSGVEGLYFAMGACLLQCLAIVLSLTKIVGNFGQTRFLSKHLALRKFSVLFRCAGEYSFTARRN